MGLYHVRLQKVGEDYYYDFNYNGHKGQIPAPSDNLKVETRNIKGWEDEKQGEWDTENDCWNNTSKVVDKYVDVTVIKDKDKAVEAVMSHLESNVLKTNEYITMQCTKRGIDMTKYETFLSESQAIKTGETIDIVDTASRNIIRIDSGVTLVKKTSAKIGDTKNAVKAVMVEDL